MTSLTVIVPSYGRPDALGRCLGALAHQQRAPLEVIVALRSSDEAGGAVARAAGARVVEVDAPGVLAAMAAGARAAHGDFVCFTDDDALPPPDWTERLGAILDSSALVGGAGGRDVLADEAGARREEPMTIDVGRLTWYGRHVGNHHRGAGPRRDVAFLKGVNCAYRRTALAIPIGLRGTGAQAHFEVAIGRHLTAQGWRLVYDPAATVEHRPAGRHGDDQRAAPSRAAVADAAYNLVVAIGGLRGLVRVAYAVLGGDRGCPGLARAAAALAQGDRATAARLGPSMAGSIQGGLAILVGRGVRYETFS